MVKSILIVDDDPKIVELIEIYLSNEGYILFKAYDGEQALASMEINKVDLVILDVMMPKVDGLEVCKQIRQVNTLPILMLSAKAEDMDKIIGIMTGADDYMIKPFNPLELAVRVKALLRRVAMDQRQMSNELGRCVRIGSLEINKDTHTVMVEGQQIKVTSLEFDILYLLSSHRGRVFSSEEIFEGVWKEDGYGASKTVMVHISNLREKLEKATGGEKIITTVWGVGYKIEA
ncbi:response regulator transcription factor [Bacillus sp. MRMR6]|uniref:response regulator transcription factor n=1 Tax=Bacillus sp. MRMR6 TaxID=1928617 RepID=UPI0009522554|nr:response regulator transcription factor [Bacillus sp. MRMR6]OLS39998.1 DNA-binding response regulator [Bacillus sp. MRMR6]